MNSELQKRFDQTRLDFNDAIAGNYEKMLQAIRDLRFAYIPGEQWSGSDTKQYRNRPKFENNTTAISIQRIHGQYQRMEFGIDIIPNSDDANEMDAKVLQGKYRDDFIKSDGIEADSNAALEAFTCGFGATLWNNHYEDDENPDINRQYLTNEPIYSAASSIVFSANALRKDKADAHTCWYLVRANRKSIEKEYNVNIASYPNIVSDSHTLFDWTADNNKDIYLAHVWEVLTKTQTEYNFDNELIIIKRDGKFYDQQGIEVASMFVNRLIEIAEPEITRKKCKVVDYSLQHGEGYLIAPEKTPFKRVPVTPRYGHYVVIEGKEYWWGEVAHKRDPQRFDNMLYSSLAQIAAQNQVAVKEYLPGQINRHANLHADKDVTNPAYLLSDPVTTDSGQEVIGPIADHQPPPIASGLQAAIQVNQGYKTQQEGTGQSTLPANASAEAVKTVNERQDDRYQSLIQNQMYSIQAGCRIYIPAAQEIYFHSQRNIRLLGADGSYSSIRTLQNTTVNNTYGPFKYSARGKYEVQVKMDEAYKDKKKRDYEEILQLLQFVDTKTPQGMLLVNQAILTTTGENTRDLRTLARHQVIDMLLSNNIQVTPETEQEEQYIQQKIEQMQAQQQQGPELTPDQQAIIQQAQAEGQARLMEGQAALKNEENDAIKNQIAIKKLENEQAALEIDAHKAGADINLKQSQALKNQAQAASEAMKTTNYQ